MMPEEATEMGNDERSVLLLVDIQPDFLPGGALAVAEGDRILQPVRGLMEKGQFGLCVATQDWHPAGHVSFASSHAGANPFEEIDLYGHPQTLWPDHCVQGSEGGALQQGLPWERVAAIVRKGMDPEVDSYSGFRNNWDRSGERPPTGLAGYLRERGIERCFICGLARDVCVKLTAEDSAAAGFETYLLWDLTRPVEPESDEAVRASLRDQGVKVIESAELPSCSES
jgi:nicotinamidase/pyrazinamidase